MNTTCSRRKILNPNLDIRYPHCKGYPLQERPMSVELKQTITQLYEKAEQLKEYL